MAAKKKIKIYLCDFVHNYLGAGTYMFPLNIGYIASYSIKYAPQDVQVKLFKYPADFIAAFKKQKADIVGFSNYTWNADINQKMSDWAKGINAQTLIVFGGPNINYTPAGYNEFFRTHKSVDFYVPYQGEKPFVNLLKAIEDKGSGGELKSVPIDGVVFYDEDRKSYVYGKDTSRIKDLDSIPSPYLTGILDEFFDTKLIPIVETNRGCPYQCTFCAQGHASHHQLEYFSLERVRAEFDYIAEHIKNTNLLHLADSNFGIAARDIEIAKYIAEMTQGRGYPSKCSSNIAKNQPKIFEIAKILKNINLVVSLQSLNEAVLENVKRSNIKIDVFKDIIRKVNAAGGISGTEIILGLPGESKASHIETIKQLFDWDVSYIICYNGLVLDGTELSITREKGDFKCQIKYRLIDSSFGRYGGQLSFETEAGILSTETMAQDELLSFRPVHWLIQFFWNYRFYFELLKYLKDLGVNPLDFILKTLEATEQAPAKVRKIFDEFRKEARSEWFDSPRELKEYYSRPENFSALEAGLFGKMNGKYIFRALLECRQEFEEYLLNKTISLPVKPNENVARDIIKFLSASIIDFNLPWEEISKEKFIAVNYDILKWRVSRYEPKLEHFYNSEAIRYRFYLSPQQEKSLKTLLKQYYHENKNVTLRKMSEYMSIHDFFYKVEEAKEHAK